MVVIGYVVKKPCLTPLNTGSYARGMYIVINTKKKLGSSRRLFLRLSLVDVIRNRQRELTVQNISDDVYQ